MLVRMPMNGARKTFFSREIFKFNRIILTVDALASKCYDSIWLVSSIAKEDIDILSALLLFFALRLFLCSQRPSHRQSQGEEALTVESLQ